MKFRVISDLHIDLNGFDSISISDDIFTVICGDTSGSPSLTRDWILKNVKSGIGVSGNHLVYNKENKTIQELRDELTEYFPINSDFTYLDTECDVFSKTINNVMFVGSCMYSDMKLSRYNETDVQYNMRISERRMNDYRYGIVKKHYPFGIDNEPSYVRMTASDYVKWFDNGMAKITDLVESNERSAAPKDIVLVTHFPLLREVVEQSFYVDDDNFMSYGSDMKDWFNKHPSVKCHCCGHTHDMHKDYRHFYMNLDHGRILVVNNSMGYLSRCHDMTFNSNTFVNTDNWTVETVPESDAVKIEKNRRYDINRARLSMFF